MTAISCHIIHLKLPSIYKVYGRNFLSTTASKFIPHRSRATCQLYKHPPGNEKKKKTPQELLNCRHTFWNIITTRTY